MAESLNILTNTSKQDQYENLIPQLEALISGETDIIANLANVSAALKQTFHFFWIGFYIVKQDQLVLGPFQGTIACTRIRYGKGVCGTAWKEQNTIIVPDVDQFPGHIACDSASRSEIVVPIFQNGVVVAVLDVDSEYLANFDETDKKYLQQIVNLLEAKF